MQWTVEDELQLQSWIDSKGFNIVYLPKEKSWGFYHDSKPTEINGGFTGLSDLKQYFVKLKGDNKNVRIVQEGNFLEEVEKARGLQKLQ